MNELFFGGAGQPQAGKLEPSSIQALQNVQFLGRPLLNSEVPNFENNTSSTEAQFTAYSPTQQRNSYILPLPIPVQVYNKPPSPVSKNPAITYSRTLYRKSDYSAYKPLPQVPDFSSQNVVSKSGLFLTPPGSPAEKQPLQHNFSRKIKRKELRSCHSHVPSVQRAATFHSESAEIQSILGSPISALSEHASFASLADSLKRSLSPPSATAEEQAKKQISKHIDRKPMYGCRSSTMNT